MIQIFDREIADGIGDRVKANRVVFCSLAQASKDNSSFKGKFTPDKSVADYLCCELAP